MTRLFVLLLLLAGLPAQAHRGSQHQPGARQSYNFDQGWLSKTGDDSGAAEPGYDDRAWEPVTLPHAFNAHQAFATDGGTLAAGITWYRKRFRLPKGAAARKVLIEFEGVRQAAEVWVNGKRIGLHENGVMAFGFDIGAALAAGENLIAVRVDNDWSYKERSSGSGFQWANRNFNANYGGINKPVTLHLAGEVYQTLPLYAGLGSTGTYIWAGDIDIGGAAATVHAESEVRNDSQRARSVSYGVAVRDLKGKLVASFSGPAVRIAPGASATLSAASRVKGLEFWSWGYGYLYTVTTSLRENGKVIDAVDTRTGFRSTAFGEGMVKLNGRVLQLKGYAQRSTNEWPAVGITVPPWLSDFSNKLMLDSNANLVRWMHITPGRQDVESADRLGLLQALPAGDAEGDVTGRRWEQRVELMRDAIIYFRNNPSVVFYEGGNKGITEEHQAQLKAMRDRYDPHGGRAAGTREMLDSKVAEYGGEMLYTNKSKRMPMWAMEYSRDEAARAYQDDFTPPFHKDAPAYNRNVESIAVENIRRWWDFYRYRPGTGARVSAGGVNIGFTDSNSHFRGDNNYRRSGEVDAMRLPKDSLWVHKVMWDGWVDAEGHHTHVIGHWTYPEGTVKDIFVASSGEQVELFRNGQSLGMGERSEGFLFTFPKVAYAPGELKAVAIHADGQRSQDVRVTAGAPVAIKLTPRTGPRGFVADGSDLMLVDVEVLDAAGRRVPTAAHMIDFKLEGAAIWKGGLAQKDGGDKRKSDNYILATALPVEQGVNRVLLRATGKAGAVRLAASAEGLRGDAVALESKAVALAGGLSRVFAKDAQPVNLGRGPTPAAPSYVERVRSLPVSAVTAGSNLADAGKSVDDNERSAWNSDGTPEGAWIEYDLGKERALGSLSMKLTGWRQRSYPLRITLDGKEIYKGDSIKSLGYFELPFTNASGRRLRMELAQPSVDRDAFGAIIEIKTAREGHDTGADKVAQGWRLSIVEMDILGPEAKSK